MLLVFTDVSISMTLFLLTADPECIRPCRNMKMFSRGGAVTSAAYVIFNCPVFFSLGRRRPLFLGTTNTNNGFPLILNVISEFCELFFRSYYDRFGGIGLSSGGEGMLQKNHVEKTRIDWVNRCMQIRDLERDQLFFGDLIVAKRNGQVLVRPAFHRFERFETLGHLLCQDGSLVGLEIQLQGAAVKMSFQIQQCHWFPRKIATN